MAHTSKKVYEVINSTERPMASINVGGKTVRFKKNGSALVEDAGVAKELNDRYGHAAKGREGGQLVVCELEAYNERRHDDPVRRTHYFTIPELPWKRGRSKDKQHA